MNTKKIFIATMFAFCCVSCGGSGNNPSPSRDSEYKTLINKMKKYTGETVMFKNMVEDLYIYSAFFTDDKNNVVISTVMSTTSTPDLLTYQWIELATAADVPSQFFCLFAAETSSVSNSGAYNISKSFTDGTSIHFTQHNFPSSTLSSAQQLASTQTSFTITIFSTWIKQNLGASLKNIGMWTSFAS